uniref:Uncharacterized protein n=1 Tax=Cajanus cajan TaxID=3821 RepID=A0A151S1J9_CAJCA|nr:hypothetical protein KK1_029700 [Cajanus cajan]
MDVTNDKKDYNIIHARRTMEQMANCLVWTKKSILITLQKGKTRKEHLGDENSKTSITTCLYLACQEDSFPRILNEFHIEVYVVKMKDIHKTVKVF